MRNDLTVHVLRLTLVINSINFVVHIFLQAQTTLFFDMKPELQN